MISVGQNFKATTRKISCPVDARITLEMTLKSVSGGSIDAKITMFQNIQLSKSETKVEYSNRILKLISELECAGYNIFRAEKKRVMLKGLSRAIDVTTETFMASDCNFHEAISKLIVRESCIKQLKEKIESSLVARGVKFGRTCYKCGKKGHISKNCWQNNKGPNKANRRETRRNFKRCKAGHVVKNYHSCHKTSNNKSETDTAKMSTVQGARSSQIQANVNQCEYWTQAGHATYRTRGIISAISTALMAVL